MDEFLDDYFKKQRITAKTTQNSTRNNLKRVEKIIKVPFEKWTPEMFDNKFIDEMMEKFQEKYKLQSILVSISILKSWLKHEDAPNSIIDELQEMVTDMVEARDDKENMQQKTEVEKKLGEDFDWDNLSSKSRAYIEERFEDAKPGEFKKLLLLGLLTLQPPVRYGNYMDVLVRKENQEGDLTPDHNYLIKLQNGKYKFIFNKFKTAKYLGQQEQFVKDDLLEEMIEKRLEQLDGDDKFFKMQNRHMTAALKDVTKKFLPEPISLNTIRHSFLTDYLSEPRSIEEKKEMANAVGQKYQVSRAEKYVRK